MNKFPNLISYFLISLSIFLIAYVFYRAEIYHSGEKTNYYFKYYITSTIFLIFSIFFLFLRNNLKIIVSIILISTLSTFYMIETYIFINSKQFKILTSNIDYDYRTQYEAYKDLKMKNKDAVSTIGPVHSLKSKNQNLFPLSGISNRKTVLCNENGYFAYYNSDRYGFNNPDEEWDKENIKFLITGDSFAQGWCVNRDDSIAGILRKKFNNQGVITLGHVGNGPLINYAALREYLFLVKPEKVLWLHFEADDLSGNYFQGLKQEVKNEILKKYLLDPKFSQNLYKKQNQVDLIVKDVLDQMVKEYEISGKNYNDSKYSFIKFLKLFNLRIFLNSKKNQLQNKNAEDIQKITPEFKSIIKMVKEIVDKNNAQLYFIFLPELKRYKYKINNNKDFNDYHNVINFIENLDIPIIDLHEEVFSKHKDPSNLFPWETDIHYTVEGYKTVTQTIIKNLIQK